MILIASADKHWAIGCKGELLVSIPADLKRFSSITTGHTVVLGRKTLETFPGGRPLKNRRNIIFSRDPKYTVYGAETVHSAEELFKALEGVDSDDIYVIGGQSVYTMLLPYCDVAYITKIDFSYTADAFLPNLDEDPEWELTEESEEQTYYDLLYTYRTYVRKKTGAQT